MTRQERIQWAEALAEASIDRMSEAEKYNMLYSAAFDHIYNVLTDDEINQLRAKWFGGGIDITV